MWWEFSETFSWAALPEWDYSPSRLPWPPGGNKRGSKEWHWFREEGEERCERWLQEKGCGAEKGYVPGKDRGGGLCGGVDGQEEFGWVQLTLTFFVDLN